MSEEEEIKTFERIRESISEAQRLMVERKAKLGETIIIADSEGKPIEISGIGIFLGHPSVQ